MMKRPKYGNKKCEYQGIEFDSRKEMQRWIVLKDAESRGEISDLMRQVEFVLIPTQYRTEVVHLKTKDKEVQRVAERACVYRADFVYERADGKIVVEDVKSKGLTDHNPEFVIKRKLMLWVHGIEIREVYKATEEI